MLVYKKYQQLTTTHYQNCLDEYTASWLTY